MKAKVIITLKNGVLDPQGKAIEGALAGLGFAGVEPDEFENEDHCRLHLKNLVNQHIGAERSPFIRFEVGSIEGKLVAVVQCERSPDPVFLKAKNKETFYIRSGPSSVELSSREVLEYVARRR